MRTTFWFVLLAAIAWWFKLWGQTPQVQTVPIVDVCSNPPLCLLSHAPANGVVLVFLNGLLQTMGPDYQLSGRTSQTLTFSPSLATDTEGGYVTMVYWTAQ
jgi:hypothetical protein